ncbi:MAG: flagellar basal body rod protein FlgB [Pseudomonadota bacterium]|uniref:Flagellar basal body rod protein FlgB n=1 Tax=Candidatus Desulfatibia profunda TaxID=2841695 RepID=A0A8J6TLP1_9BACT|nr:flagellar basal body rod protein FlgB [Candidatus Desulfatibia profunda]MBL7195975.1 flagellar basal body rod protein FlgB [Desulfobacterales bacterium]MBU0698830.1 flagellar basal body rod protein FlgB [Pseudomonadota bacterium]
MPDKISFSKTFQALERAISITQKRHALITSNISNIDTSGYKPKDVDFNAALERALTSEHGVDLVQTNPSHIALEMSGAAEVETIEETSGWNGYNWVNIDKEMTRLSENNLIYRTSVEILLKKIAILKEVIREGGR